MNAVTINPVAETLTPAQKRALTIKKNKALKLAAENLKKVNAAANKKAIAKLKRVKKSPVKGKGHLKTEARIQQLTDIEKNRTLTTRELTWLFSADIKLESRSRSKVYNYLSKEYFIKEEGKAKLKKLSGRTTMPAFKDFNEKMPVKFLYSYFDGLRVLAKFNKKAIAQSKIAKQNKATAKK